MASTTSVYTTKFKESMKESAFIAAVAFGLVVVGAGGYVSSAVNATPLGSVGGMNVQTALVTAGIVFLADISYNVLLK